MKKTLLLSLLFIASLAISCKKEKADSSYIILYVKPNDRTESNTQVAVTVTDQNGRHIADFHEQAPDVYPRPSIIRDVKRGDVLTIKYRSKENHTSSYVTIEIIWKDLTVLSRDVKVSTTENTITTSVF